jgi:hypothetical protein
LRNLSKDFRLKSQEFVMRFVLIILLSFSPQAISMGKSQAKSSHEKSYQRPAPHGDTRMGADAANSGTDITDQDIQAQEDKRGNTEWEAGPEELQIEDKEALEPMQK